VPEGFTINGVSLDTYAYMLTDISGAMTVPGRRGDNVAVPGRHGVIRTPGKRFDAGEIVLPMWVVGSEEDGSIPVDSTARRAWFRRRDELLRLLYADPLTLAFAQDRDDPGSWREIEAEVVDVLSFVTIGAAPEAQVSVALTTPAAFWQDRVAVAQEVTGASGVAQALDAFEGATAPMADLLITIQGPCDNPMIAHGARWVKYNGVLAAGQQLVLDTELWRVSTGTGTPWAPELRNVEYSGSGAGWFELDPTIVPFEVVFTHTGGGTATATIAGRRKYLVP
jgi:hypothetical protein